MTVVTEHLRQLHEAISDFDLPEARKTASDKSDLLWLARNMGARNSGHPRHGEAMGHLKRALRAS